MKSESKRVKREVVHPGPYCIECKKPFGVERPVGYISNTGEPVYCQEVVGTDRESFCLCLSCMKDKRRDLSESFIATLNDEQRKIFNDLSKLESSISSYVILMS